MQNSKFDFVKDYFKGTPGTWNAFEQAVKNRDDERAFSIGRAAGLSMRDISYIITNDGSCERFVDFITDKAPTFW